MYIPAYTHLNPVSDPLVVGFVLDESVKVFAELLCIQYLLLLGFLRRWLLTKSKLHLLLMVHRAHIYLNHSRFLFNQQPIFEFSSLLSHFRL